MTKKKNMGVIGITEPVGVLEDLYQVSLLSFLEEVESFELFLNGLSINEE